MNTQTVFVTTSPMKSIGDTRTVPVTLRAFPFAVPPAKPTAWVFRSVRSA